ncbi:hypothetical protein MHBO_001189 [Bonamia ostreae]|uniref:Uncharacterized protein n=1 Tax=Bonamia ostreae TaxID=126728 RepID=A0ABV2AI27_9EUKA
MFGKVRKLSKIKKSQNFLFVNAKRTVMDQKNFTNNTSLNTECGFYWGYITQAPAYIRNQAYMKWILFYGAVYYMYTYSTAKEHSANADLEQRYRNGQVCDHCGSCHTSYICPHISEYPNGIDPITMRPRPF